MIIKENNFEDSSSKRTPKRVKKPGQPGKWNGAKRKIRKKMNECVKEI